MTPEQAAAYVHAQAVAAQIEMEAMKAENRRREDQGKSLAYGEEEFASLIDKYGLHHNAVITIFNNAG
jgi:hypothetical protein